MRTSNTIDVTTLSHETEGERSRRHIATVGKSLLIFTSIFVIARNAMERLFPARPPCLAMSDEHFSLSLPELQRNADVDPDSILREHAERLLKVRELRQEIRGLVSTVVNKSGSNEVSIVLSKLMEKDSLQNPKAASEHLSEVAAATSPEIVQSMHRLAELLQEHPELAPDLLPAVRECLDTLNMSDPRKYIGSLIPATVSDLENRTTVQNVAQGFLKKEEARGAYEEKPATAETIPVNDFLLDPNLPTLTI